LAAVNHISAAPGAALGRFAAVAGCGWCLDAACLLLLARVLPPALANVASSLMAATFVYLVAHHFVHEGRRSLVGLRLAVYSAYTLVLIVAASAALGAVAPVIARYAAGSAAILLAKVAITPPQFLLNFIMSRLIARAAAGPA